MAELTITYTAEITEIHTGPDEDLDKALENVASPIFKDIVEADLLGAAEVIADVHIKDFKVFVSKEKTDEDIPEF